MGRIRFDRHLESDPDELRPPAAVELRFRARMEGGPGAVELVYRLPEGGPVAFEVDGEPTPSLSPEDAVTLPGDGEEPPREVVRSARIVWAGSGPARDPDTALLTATLRPVDGGRSRGTRTMLTLRAE